MKKEIIKAAASEFEQAVAAHADLLTAKTKRTINVRLSVTPIAGGRRIAGACTANGKSHFSFGTIITKDPEEL